jgi:UDP-glucose 4-epimerase
MAGQIHQSARKMHRILITGGAGFIGSYTAHALVARGCQVRVVDNLSSGRISNLGCEALPGGRIRFFEGDVRDRAAVQAALEGCDAVLHLAAQVSVQRSVADPLGSAGNNILGFLNVLEAVRLQRVPRLVYASSAAVFGAPDRLPVSEHSQTRPVSPYGLEKLVNEQYAAMYRDLYGVSSLGMRYFNVYGPLQDPDSPYAGVISKFAAALDRDAELTVFGDGLQTRDFIYVGDVAQANVRALAATCVGVLNVATGSSASLLQLIETMGGAFGRPAQVRHLPATVGDILHSASTADQARAALDWTADTPLAAGLQALAASLRPPAR